MMLASAPTPTGAYAPLPDGRRPSRAPSFSGDPRTPNVAGMTSIPDPPAEPQDSPERYVGLAPEDAERQARAAGWSTIRSLPPGAIITMEYLVGRLNFEVKEGVVTRSWKG
ncbi:hypothetical protein SALBM135S_07843 [Streptomyces alboniger]